MKNTLLFCCFFTITSAFTQGIRNIENDKLSPMDTDLERYNRDNKVYKTNKEFIFDYVIIKNNDSLKCQPSTNSDGIPNWQLVKSDADDTISIHAIGIAILPYYLHDDQTGIGFKYYNKNKRLIKIFENTGLVENDKNTWTHPPRSDFFAITEFNSFPYIKAPFVVGNKWTSGVKAGYSDLYQRFNLKWEVGLDTYETLEIIEKVQLPTAFGVLPCFVVRGISKSNLTETTSLFYYNETYGFVKIVYDLFDKSRLELNLKEIGIDVPPPQYSPLRW